MPIIRTVTMANPERALRSRGEHGTVYGETSGLKRVMKKGCVIAFLILLCAEARAESNQPMPLKTVRPSYPEIAKQMRIGGTVKLRITVDAKGAVAKVEPIGGNAMLIDCAQKAVLKWKYPPSGAESTIVVSVIFDPDK